MQQLWSEAYRPKYIKDYVFKDEKQKTFVLRFVVITAPGLCPLLRRQLQTDL